MPIRIPSSSLAFFFNDFEFSRISVKPLKFPSVVFSIPTAPTISPVESVGLTRRRNLIS